MAIRVIDFETSGLNFWSPDFKVVSMAVSWINEDTDQIQNWFTKDFNAMVRMFKRMIQLGDQIVAHNLAFEYGVTTTCFKGHVDLDNLLWWADTARLAQMTDNGGAGSDKQARFGLDQCVMRLLPKQYWSHKKEADDWIKQNVRLNDVKKRKWGRKIPWTIYYTKERAPKKKEIPGYRDRLPVDILEKYNKADTDNTLRLYQVCLKMLEARGIDWRIDHEYYLGVTKLIVEAQLRGVRIKQAKLSKHVDAMSEKVEAIDQLFRSTFSSELEAIEAKTGKKFNVNSKKQLASLFVEQLGMEPKILTPKGAPSFKAAHLSQWGDGGLLLRDRGKFLKIIEHSTKLIEVSQEDGLWHLSLRTTGTRTGRFAGSGGVNCQGLARRNKGLMSSLVPTESSNVFVSSDLVSAEPCVTAHYSGDRNYILATFEMQGKRPYFDGDTLIISDIYLMVMSRSPTSRQVLLDAWKKTDWPAGTFPDQWVADSEVIKSYLKSERSFCKALCLGLGYGMQPKRLAKTAAESGRPISLKVAKEFYDSYWTLFSGLKFFADKCEETVERRGFIMNCFGYCNLPEPRKSFNAFIQSTVSGIINYLLTEWLEKCPYAKLVTVVHDEIILEVPRDKVEDLREQQKKTLQSINEVLSWKTRVELGFVVGENLYDAK